ncbi:hypothetical protein ONZ45_g17083 [Pleurotus djamor]|nr:hypothetical protein ONZ45_g17083 [Pleurotus djamor]
MSFSSTPLGQGRRLDHSTFLGKNTIHPHRSAPKIITSPPRSPEKFKDTTVNVATAFTQAVLQSESMNPNDSWASGASASYRNIPRSTSVEYEKETQNTGSRRLAPPPRRTFGPQRTTKPLSKSGSVNSNVAPDSEQDDDQTRLENRSYQRGKSPLVEAVNGLYNKSVSFVMRARGTDAETTTNLNGQPENTSYSYEQEEAQYEASQPTTSTATRKPLAHRRKTMSVDNKAYKPSQSDLEQSDSDYDGDDGRRRRRKSKKGGPNGGPLTSLPVAQYDKKKRRRSKGGKGDVEGDEDSAGDDVEEHNSQSNSIRRSSVPPQALVDDDSMDFAEQGLTSIPEGDEDLEIGQSSKESELLSPHVLSDSSRRSRSATPRPAAKSFSIGAFLGGLVNRLASIVIGFFYFSGKLTGLVLRTIMPFSHSGPQRYLSIGLVLCLGWYFALLPTSIHPYLPVWNTPNRTLVPPVAPPADFAEISARLQAIEAAYVKLSASQDQLRNDGIRSRDEFSGNIRSFSGDIGRVSSDLGKLKSQIGTLDGRLGTVDSSVGTLSVQIGSLGGDLSKLGRQLGSLGGQLSTLEGRVENDRANKGTGPSANTGEVAAIRKDVASLGDRLRGMADIVDKLESLGKHQGDHQRMSEEVYTQIRTFEERLSSVEGNVKDSLEQAKSPQDGSKPWWSKFPISKTGSSLTIKTADGQDVSSLLSELVSSIVIGYFAKDILGKPDYAMYSAGARVLPSFTSDTYEIKPSTLRGSIYGLFTGSGYAVGRPPVTALHPEIHNGHCWPFAGTEGSLGVALNGPVVIEEFVVEHVPQDVAYDLRSAPREMEVWGLVEGFDNLKRFAAWREERRQQKEAEGHWRGLRLHVLYHPTSRSSMLCLDGSSPFTMSFGDLFPMFEPVLKTTPSTLLPSDDEQLLLSHLSGNLPGFCSLSFCLIPLTLHIPQNLLSAKDFLLSFLQLQLVCVYVALGSRRCFLGITETLENFL